MDRGVSLMLFPPRFLETAGVSQKKFKQRKA